VDNSEYTLGVDLGGTKIKCVGISNGGDVIHTSYAPTEDSGDESWRTHVRDGVESVQRTIGYRAKAIGMAAPGIATKDNRSISWMGGRMVGPVGVDWTEQFNVSFPVWVMNDAHAALVGEHWKGSATQFENVAMLTLGTGVGGAIMLNGEILQGTIGRAGHLGHICLDPQGVPGITNVPGSLEDAIGNWTVSSRSNGKFESTQALVNAVEQGDSEAKIVWESSIYQLACGIVSIMNVIDPEAIILGGGIAETGEALFGPLRKYLEKLEWRPNGHKVPIKSAILGDLAGAYGAARFASDKKRVNV
jgi:glucokinase